MSAVLSKPAKKPAASTHKYDILYKTDPLDDADAQTKERVALLLSYIMKHCLWQFNSRGWDRRKQSAGVLGKTAQLLCNEAVENPTRLEQCYWVDAVLLDRAYRERFPWITTLSKDEVKTLIGRLHAHLDWLTIDGSLNLELSVKNY
jgi:nitrogenase delta subunit